MNILSTILILAATILSSTHAIPTPNKWTCPAGKNYYNCNTQIIKFDGCCSVDPCALPNCPDAPFDNPFEGPRIPVPGGATDRPSCTPGHHKVFNPTMYTIDVSSSIIASAADTRVHVSKCANSTAITEQIALFSNIPSWAKGCALSWTLPPVNDLKVDQSGYLEVFEVDTPLPRWGVSWLSMGKGAKVGDAEFADWVSSTAGVSPAGVESGHSVGSVKGGCKESLAFRLGVEVGLGHDEGSVSFSQKAQEGFYVEFDC